jgi:hypothetical protein
MAGVAPDLAGLTLEISVSSPSPDGQIDRKFDAWRERYPIYLALLKTNEIDLAAAKAEVV